MQAHPQLEYGFPHGHASMHQVGVAQSALGQHPMTGHPDVDDVSVKQDEIGINGFNNLSMYMKSSVKTTKDGLPAKKRGPKRDSKPAQSRRQELNRHAQRTHRERKETYIKGLELEVCRLKEEYTKIAIAFARAQPENSELLSVKRENHLLKQLLDMHGISYDIKSQIATPPPSTGQLSVPQPLSPSHSASFNSSMRQQQQPSEMNFSSSPYGLSSAPGQNHNAGHNAMDLDNAALASANNFPTYNNANMSPASSAISSQGSVGFHSHSHSSTNGSNFGPGTIASNSNTAVSSPVYPASQQMTDPDTIDSILEESRTPSYDQGFTHGLPTMNGKPNGNPNGMSRVKVEPTVTPILASEQSAVDFILALEEGCRSHQGHCNRLALPSSPTESNLILSGHAMQLSNPPPTHMSQSPNVEYHQPPADLPLPNLMVLMDTASRIPMRQGEITPILALKKIRSDPRFRHMDRTQWKQLTERLKARTRCYGFGSALEEGRVEEELNAICGASPGH